MDHRVQLKPSDGLFVESKFTREHIIEVLKKHYPVLVHVQMRFAATKMEHYYVAGKLKPVLDEFWVCLNLY